MKPVLGIVVLSLIALAPVSTASAQAVSPSEAATLPLEELLKVEVVSTASRFPQEVREAPASITIVTARDIQRFNYRTLADVLRSVRGVYLTYDRNYTYLGIRGFSRPGDYNTRVLLLVDGHRLNDQIYDMAPLGTEFPVDVSLIDRVEVIRGPASSLYGTNAFMGVINVVTRTGGQHAGLRFDTAAGSLGTAGGTLSYGRVFSSGDLLVSASARHADGNERLYYPEFDSGTPGSGVAVGLDTDRSANVFGSVTLGRTSVRGGASWRAKEVPTAAFRTRFGPGLETTDRRLFLDAQFEGHIGRGWTGSARAGFDYYGYEGTYPYEDPETGPVPFFDIGDGRSISGDLAVRRRIARRHLFTFGGEVRRQIRNYQHGWDEYETLVDLDVPATVAGAYMQDEVRLFPWLVANAGLRLDRYDSFGAHVTPRAALVFLPGPRTSIKLLHGRAFRAPNAYELHYYAATQPDGLEPERVQSTELVWEQYASEHVRTAFTVFSYEADRLIEQRSFGLTFEDDLYFANAGRVTGRGMEAEVEVRLHGGVSARWSHTYARVRDALLDRTFSNSPRHLSKFGVHLPMAGFWLSVDGDYVGSRLTLDGEPIDGFFAPNITLGSSPSRRLDLSLSVFNALNTAYSDPGGEEHLQRAIPQDGRTALARVRVRF